MEIIQFIGTVIGGIFLFIIWINSIIKAKNIGAKKGMKSACITAAVMWGPLGLWLAKHDIKKRCPYCRGVIDNKARICIHCGNEYDESMWEDD